MFYYDHNGQICAFKWLSVITIVIGGGIIDGIAVVIVAVVQEKLARYGQVTEYAKCGRS